ncbi:alpha-ribazole phosphatase family protein [Methylomonas sp. LL1]|uniref:histidine phosphatase family protein n=1 Tax=Methylomonas sp. LL1 TaxID=2785785 RepID=UPI0018C42E86|nr:alpha-ribazole phosphatase family protein [Methylomonas sp. LL1]QPK63313.1 alpha-ribazole phosphatase family protein [Methylomonas sp. LL1]
MSSICKPTVIDFLRHGEVQGGDYFRGVTDDPLTDHGRRQMFNQCGVEQWQAVVSSPLRRCASFASSWGQAHQVAVEMDSGLMEINFGDWEGQTAERINYLYPNLLQAFYDDPACFTPPNAESYTCFVGRIQNAWERLLINHAGQRVLVVTHAGVIRVLFSLLLSIPPRQSFQIEVPHACLTRFSCFDDVVGRFVQLNFHKPV